jgi:hypothetical protein
MARHAIVDKDNKVVNVVIWEGAEWLPPRNHMVVNCPDEKCDIGDTYDPVNKVFIPDPSRFPKPDGQ